MVNVCCHDYGTPRVRPPRGIEGKEEGHVGPRSGPSVTTYGPSILEVVGLITLLFLVSLSTDTFVQVEFCRCMLYIYCVYIKLVAECSLCFLKRLTGQSGLFWFLYCMTVLLRLCSFCRVIVWLFSFDFKVIHCS